MTKTDKIIYHYNAKIILDFITKKIVKSFYHF